MNESNAGNLDATAKIVPTSESTFSFTTASSDELLSKLLGKMDKLDKLDGIETQISNFQ